MRASASVCLSLIILLSLGKNVYSKNEQDGVVESNIAVKDDTIKEDTSPGLNHAIERKKVSMSVDKILENNEKSNIDGNGQINETKENARIMNMANKTNDIPRTRFVFLANGQVVYDSALDRSGVFPSKDKIQRIVRMAIDNSEDTRIDNRNRSQPAIVNAIASSKNSTNDGTNKDTRSDNRNRSQATIVNAIASSKNSTNGGTNKDTRSDNGNRSQAAIVNAISSTENSTNDNGNRSQAAIVNAISSTENSTNDGTNKDTRSDSRNRSQPAIVNAIASSKNSTNDGTNKDTRSDSRNRSQATVVNAIASSKNSTNDGTNSKAANDIRRRRETSDKPQYDNRHDGVTIKTLDDEYYDWGFAVPVAPSLSRRDSKAEVPVLTDLSCWVCDGRHSSADSCVFTRCDYAMTYDSRISPKGFSCIRYEVSSFWSTSYISSCTHAESSTYHPCEGVAKQKGSEGIKNCRLCTSDGCNAWPRSKLFIWLMLAALILLALCCCCYVCLRMYTKSTTCRIPKEKKEECPAPPENESVDSCVC